MPHSPSILFVCMGNICRSPAAEGIFEAFVKQQTPSLEVQIDSAGTHGYHVGNPPDPRMREAAQRRGFPLTSRARQVQAHDLQRFDLVLAMDRENLAIIETLDEGDASKRHAQLRLFSHYLGDDWPSDVPDPYYGGQDGFEYVLDMIEAACPAIWQDLNGFP